MISDYGKGVCGPELCRYVIDRGNSRGIFIVVDTKGNDWFKYAGATVVSPKVKELSGDYPIQIKRSKPAVQR